MPNDREEVQEARRRLLNDPEAAAAQEHLDQMPTDTAESVQADNEYAAALAELDEPRETRVLIGAQVTEGGIAVEILIPWDSIGFGEALKPQIIFPDDAATGAEDPIN